MPTCFVSPQVRRLLKHQEPKPLRYRADALRILRDAIHTGQTFSASVSRVTPSGVRILVGMTPAYVPVHEVADALRHRTRSDLQGLVKPGQAVAVRILAVDATGTKITCSMRQPA